MFYMKTEAKVLNKILVNQIQQYKKGNASWPSDAYPMNAGFIWHEKIYQCHLP